MTIGERIKAFRKGKGLSQKELGEILGVSGAMIGQYETGQRKPRLDTLQRIATALGVEWTELVPEDEQGTAIVTHVIEKAGLTVTDKDGNVIHQGDGRKWRKLSAEEVYRLGILKPLPTPIERVTRDMSQMTQEGQEKVAGYAADILPRYRAETASQSAPPPSEGNDTTPSPNAPETPPEGE